MGDFCTFARSPDSLTNIKILVAWLQVSDAKNMQPTWKRKFYYYIIYII